MEKHVSYKIAAFFQDLIESFRPTNRRIVDLTCSIGVCIVATRACGKHFFAFDGDNDMLEHILKPLLEKIPK